MIASLRHTPHARTWMRTCAGPGLGIFGSTILSPAPGAVTCAALIVSTATVLAIIPPRPVDLSRRLVPLTCPVTPCGTASCHVHSLTASAVWKIGKRLITRRSFRGTLAADISATFCKRISTPQRRIYSTTSAITSSSIGMPRGRLATPRTSRTHTPSAPKTSRNKSDAPSATAG